MEKKRAGNVSLLYYGRLYYFVDLLYDISMHEAFENELISDYLAGDEQALELLVGEYLRPIYSFVSRFVGNAQEAEDITQDVFVRAWRNLKKSQKNFKQRCI